MAKIVNRDLFGWDSLKEMPDLARMELFLGELDDEEIVRKLERQRGRGRDDYPVRPMWNMVVLFPLTGTSAAISRQWRARVVTGRVGVT